MDEDEDGEDGGQAEAVRLDALHLRRLGAVPVEAQHGGVIAKLGSSGLGAKVVGIFKETASGSKNDRTERKKVLALAQARQIDAVLVSELSRWGRSHCST